MPENGLAKMGCCCEIDASGEVGVERKKRFSQALNHVTIDKN